MTEILEQQTRQNDSVVHEFGPLFMQLAKPAEIAPFDAGLATLVANINTPQFRRGHPAQR